MTETVILQYYNAIDTMQIHSMWWSEYVTFFNSQENIVTLSEGAWCCVGNDLSVSTHRKTLSHCLKGHGVV